VRVVAQCSRQHSLGEQHVISAGLSIGLVSSREASLFRVAMPVAALLVLLAFWSLVKAHRPEMLSVPRFLASVVLAVVATVAGSGGVAATAAWAASKLVALRAEAALLAGLGLTSVLAGALAPVAGEEASKSRARKWFHALMTGLLAGPLLVFGPSARSDESIALGAALGVCCLLAAEAFRNFSGSSSKAAQRLNAWYEEWLDEKERGSGAVAFSHVYLVVGCALPFGLLHFAAVEQRHLAARLAGVIAVGIGKD